MTGGQMAPTTLLGMRTTTTPFGRDARLAGYPIRVVELLNTLRGPAYLARGALRGPAQIPKAKKALRRAFQAQLEGKGFSLVEVLSTCPVTWGMQPIDAVHWLEEDMLPEDPLGGGRTPGGREGGGGPAPAAAVGPGEPIGSPVVSDPPVVIIMNRPSMDKFESRVRGEGLLIVNSSMVDRAAQRSDVRVVTVDAVGEAPAPGGAGGGERVTLG